MDFSSDNTAKMHPKVLEALQRANHGTRPSYGADAEMQALTQRMRQIFDAPEAAVYLVATGTAANALLLATYANPWDTIFCTRMAHIHEDECNAPEFYSGAKLTLVESEQAKMTADTVRAAVSVEEKRGVHGPQRGPISVTQATEKGTVYSVCELEAIGAVAQEYGCGLHLDGARFTNALASLGCSAAEMTWKAGIDAVSFGGTKNGLMGVEACVLFDPKKAWEFELRRKRGGHLLSKNRFAAAQMNAYLEDGLWLEMASHANSCAATLAQGLREGDGVTCDYSVDANIVFFKAPRSVHQALHALGAQYYLWDGELDDGDASDVLTGRLVCSWDTSLGDVSKFCRAVQKV